MAGSQLTVPVTAVSGVPRLVGTEPASTPLNNGTGYDANGWSIQKLSESGSGKPLWSTTLHAPAGVPAANPELQLTTYPGYVVASGGRQGVSYVGAVSSSGRPGPSCALPAILWNSFDVYLLPHAGIVLLENTGGSVDAYSTATGRRLWSVQDEQTGGGQDAGGDLPDFMVIKDTVFLWQEPGTGDPQVAAYDALTGQHLWSTSFRTDPAAISDDVLLGVFGGRVYTTVYKSGGGSGLLHLQVVALKAASGAVAWRRAVSQSSTVGLGAGMVTQVGSDVLVSASYPGYASYLLNVSTGVTLGTTVGDGGGSPQACYPAGKLTAAITVNGAIRLLSADAALDRTIPIAGGSSAGEMADVVVTDTEAYVLPTQPGASVVYGYDLATGDLLWTLPVPGTNSAQYTDTLVGFDGGFVVYNEGDFVGGTVVGPYYVYR